MLDKLKPYSVERGRATIDVVHYEDYEELYELYVSNITYFEEQCTELKQKLRDCVARHT